ncbi:VF530 family protein [bacterium]|nr:VF530 family protein [bacterium]
MSEQPNNPLHGIKLQDMLIQLEDHYGWDELADRIRIKCFANEPSLNSCLKFLRRTPWARTKVEFLFKETFID